MARVSEISRALFHTRKSVEHLLQVDFFRGVQIHHGQTTEALGRHVAQPGLQTLEGTVTSLACAGGERENTHNCKKNVHILEDGHVSMLETSKLQRLLLGPDNPATALVEAPTCVSTSDLGIDSADRNAPRNTLDFDVGG